MVGGGVCRDHSLTHEVEKQSSSTGSEVVGKVEDFECCGEDGVGVVAGCG